MNDKKGDKMQHKTLAIENLSSSSSLIFLPNLLFNISQIQSDLHRLQRTFLRLKLKDKIKHEFRIKINGRLIYFFFSFLRTIVG